MPVALPVVPVTGPGQTIPINLPASVVRSSGGIEIGISNQTQFAIQVTLSGTTSWLAPGAYKIVDMLGQVEISVTVGPQTAQLPSGASPVLLVEYAVLPDRVPPMQGGSVASSTLNFLNFIQDSVTLGTILIPASNLNGPNDDVWKGVGMTDGATFVQLLTQMVGPNDTLASPVAEGTVTLAHN